MVRLAIDPPPSVRQERPRRWPVVSAFLVTVLIALGAGFALGRWTAPEGAVATAAAPAAAAPAAPAAPAPAVPPAEAAAPTIPVPTPSSAPPSSPTPPANGIVPAAAEVPVAVPVVPATLTMPAGAPVRRLVATLKGSLEESVAAALPKEERAHAEELTAVVNRLLVWDFQVSRDGRPGDRLEVLWSPPVAAAAGLPASGEPVVVAVRYASSKLGQVLSAYRYETHGARWARYYRANAAEVESRLVDTPIAEYEQITSLLRDGRRHKGVDFKAPVGSPVVAPFDGVIERRNWNFAGNGNCLDIRDPATGRHAIFLHLDVLPKEMQPGRKVKKGEVIASSGNSGRSYAPHLHYQLEDASGRVLDPFDVHRTERRTLPQAERPAFEALRAKLDAALGG
jgi:murein DD-endopeptidase MepM/ murein hydrolase activator NlpD